MVAAGCSSSIKTTTQPPIPSSPEKLCVAVSIVPQATFVKAVAGELVDVVTIIPPGANPENYAPTPQTMEQLSATKIYFAIGVPAEDNGVLSRLEQINSQMKLVNLSTQVDQIYPAREISPGEKDPHRWLSPKRVIEMVKIISVELAAIDPQNAVKYLQNAQAYQTELEKLHTDIAASLEGLSGQSFVVYHPAMGYFADDYNLKMIALEEEGKEATAKHLQTVIDQAKKENIKVIFYQAEMDSKQAQTFAREMGGQAELIAPLAPDYIDNLRKTAQTFSQVLQNK
jgi:zinc transport system substrate-binding protein